MYAKVFASLWQGTLYGHTDAQLVFIFLLAHADADGNVRCVTEAIAGPTGLDIDRVRAALTLLEGPDSASGSDTDDGRRLERIGNADRWQIVNYQRYRSLKDADTVRAQTNERVRKHRLKRSVTLGNAPKRQEEVEVEVEVDKSTPSVKSTASENVKEAKIAFIQGFWPKYPRKVAKQAALKSFLSKCKSEKDFQDIMEGLEWYLQREWSNRDIEKIPHPSTWLNQERYRDAEI